MFSEDLKETRKRSGFTQSIAADALQIPKRTWEDWEAGRREPQQYVQRLVLKELNSVIDQSLFIQEPDDQRANRIFIKILADNLLSLSNRLALHNDNSRIVKKVKFIRDLSDKLGKYIV